MKLDFFFLLEDDLVVVFFWVWEVRWLIRGVCFMGGGCGRVDFVSILCFFFDFLGGV